MAGVRRRACPHSLNNPSCPSPTESSSAQSLEALPSEEQAGVLQEPGLHQQKGSRGESRREEAGCGLPWAGRPATAARGELSVAVQWDVGPDLDVGIHNELKHKEIYG